MPTVTLQLSFDSSYIDFNIEKEENFLHKVSLLSVGNSYAGDLAPVEFEALKKLLFLFNNTANDKPNLIRAWRVKKVGEKFIPSGKCFDFKLVTKTFQNTDQKTDCDEIQKYYLQLLDEQVTEKEHLIQSMSNQISIDIDETYEVDKRVGKANSLISQTSQKLTPYNEYLQFLYLLTEKELEFKMVDLFYNPEQDKDYHGIVFFPVSDKPDSIWYSADTEPVFVNGLATINYTKSEILNEIEIKRASFTMPTKLPKSDDYDGGSVTLRKDGKYVGEVAIKIGQDNDWKVNFNDTLSALLDCRDSFIEFVNDEKLETKYKNLIANFFDGTNSKEKIQAAINYFLNPLSHIPDYRTFILEAYRNTAIADSGIEDPDTLKEHLTELDTKIAEITKNIAIYTQLVNPNKLIVEFARQKNETLDLDASSYVIEEAGIPAGIKSEALLKLLNQLYNISNDEDFIAIFTTILFNITKFTGPIELDLANKKVNIKGADAVPITSPKNINLNGLWYRHVLLQPDKNQKYTNLLDYLLENEVDDFNLESIFKTILKLYISDAEGFSLFPLFVNSSIEVELFHSILKKINERFQDTQPTNDQVPIRIQIGKSNQIVPAKKDEDDLSDELSGYVLVSTRSKQINNEASYGDWKHHNYAKAKIKLVDNNATPPTLTELTLNSAFLIPGYLPVENDTQKIFLEISNEKASLAATIEGLNDSVKQVEVNKKLSSKLSYFLESDADKLANNPYGLLYGYYYKFAAFAILNSGVLPEVLREDKNVLNKFNEKIVDISGAPQEPYQYLRTKKIPAPQVKINDIKVYPKQLNPLYNELYPEDPNKEKDRCNKLLIVGEKFNNDFTITVEKPRTSFWDCYSFAHSRKDDYKLLNPKEDDLPDKEKYKRFIDYIDPAVSGKLYIEITEKHLLAGVKSLENTLTLDYDAKAHDGNNQVLNLKNCAKKIRVQFDPNAASTTLDPQNALIKLRPGCIYSIKIYNLIDSKYFDKDNTEYRFHECISKKYHEIKEFEVPGTQFYKIGFDEHIIETALVEPIEQNKITPEELWNDLKINEKLPSVANFNEKNQSQNESSIKAIIGGNSEKYKLYSRVDVQHQKWEWNGRQINIDVTQLMDPADPSKDLLNPSIKPDGIYSITEAMKFEAWAFSERPDYTATKTQARILASEKNKDNIVHEYKNVIDNHCMYLRYAVQIFNRYELLGEPYKNSIKGEIPIEKSQPKNKTNPWKRHLKLSKRTEALPTPAVRFYIPLTNSIEEANDLNDTADVMLVLDDVAYKEAGLAQKLTLGIRKAKDPNSEYVYPEAGYDPTLSLIETKPLQTNNEGDYLIVDEEYLKGPFGFTFDFNATNSKINSSSFIISGNGLSNYLPYDLKKEDPHWPMFKLSVRSEIIPVLHEFYFDKDLVDKVDKLKSEWSSSQWVQFMKAVDSFVPSQWRDEVRKKGFLELKKDNLKEKLNLNILSQFGKTFEHFHNWYLIFSIVESNIGGLPIENYYNTFIVNEINNDLNALKFVHLPAKNISSLPDGYEGYVRIMIVRKSEDYDIKKTNENVWDELFGKDDSKIKEDNTLAMPILSERIPITIKK